MLDMEVARHVGKVVHTQGHWDSSVALALLGKLELKEIIIME